MSDPAQLVQIDACLAQLGGDRWADPFVDLAESTGAAQVMVFSYAPDNAACLFSRNFRQSAVGARLSRDYLDGWFREDPLFVQVLRLPVGGLALVESGQIVHAMSSDYRARFYDQPGLSGKTAVLAAGSQVRLVLNLYWQDEPPVRQSPLIPLLARLALLHFEARPENSMPAPLTVLSDRERDVCLGILSGKKAELIAGELGIAPSSVVTYRARAYTKLGISSRGALFALCGA